MEKLIQFKKEDNHYSRFIDALKNADMDYINNGECKKHFNKNWWTKYNHLAIKDSIKSHNVNIFKLIPKELLSNDVTYKFIIKYANEKIFKEYSYNSSWQNICKIYLHRDTSDEIKKLCISMEGDHLNNMIPWVTNEVEEKNNITDEEMKLLNKNYCNMDNITDEEMKLLNENYYNMDNNMSLQYYNNNNYCIEYYIKKDDTILLEQQLDKKSNYLIRECFEILHIVYKYKSLNILQFLLKHGQYYEDSFNNIDKLHNPKYETIKFVAQYSVIPIYTSLFTERFYEQCKDKKLINLLKEYEKNYLENIDKVRQYLNIHLFERFVSLYYEDKIESYENRMRQEKQERYGFNADY